MESIKNFLYRFVPGPLFLLFTYGIWYEWHYEGAYWVWLGFIPVTPVLMLGGLAMGIYLTKLGYIDGDVSKIIDLLGEKKDK